MIILGIETTCDETGAAVVKDGCKVLSNVVASSVDLQKNYGGVVPEVAAREQVRVIIPVIREALELAFGSIRINNSCEFGYPIDAIAVAHGPGLIGSLLIGVETAKTLALAWDKPLIAVNHLVGHVYANWLQAEINRGDKGDRGITDNRLPKFPLVALIVSGGHTDLVLMKGHGDFKLLGSTLDDAAGEAFDKVAKFLGLGYPGGPEIEKVASNWSQVTSNQKLATSYQLPRPMINSKNFDFSFSGLKTAVVNIARQHLRGDVESSTGEHLGGESETEKRAAIAHEFQQAVVDVLVKKTVKAAQKFGAKSIVVGGGVAANKKLRHQLSVNCSQLNIPVFFPSKNLSVDNGAMIAAAAFFNFKSVDPLKLSADPALHFS